MKDLFIELNKVLPSYELDGLNKGVYDEQLDYFSKMSKRMLPSVFRKLYQWHNGSSWKLKDGKPPIFIFNFFSLNEILNYEYWGLVNIVENFDSRKFIPIGEIDDMQAIVLIQSGESHDSSVYIYYSGDGDLEVWHENLEAMLKTSIDFFGSLDDKGMFAKEFDEIRLSYSPNAG